MRREGRIHGCNVRVGKRQVGHRYGEKVASGHPTNQSKCTVKRPLAANAPSAAHVVALTEHAAHPAQKSMGKIKHAFKAKDLDITRNYLMQDWRVYERRSRAAADDDERGDEEEDEEHTTAEEAEEKCQYWDAYCEHWDDSGPGAGGDGEDARASEMVVPIESLLTTMRKRSSKRNAKARLAAAAAAAQERAQPQRRDSGEGAPESPGDSSSGDEFESWWGLGFYDGEEISDDWFLITEEEGFVA